MTEMEERVARAIAPSYDQNPDEWEKAAIRSVARAAIKAIREPTEAMRIAARDVWKAHQAKRIEITDGNGSLPHPDWEVHYHHAMMIDAALGTEK